MGVKGLWGLLGDCVETLSGEEQVPLIAGELENTCVAVDLSLWIAQAQLVNFEGTGYSASPQARALKVVFERVWMPVQRCCKAPVKP